MEKGKTTGQDKLSSCIKDHFEFFNNPEWCPLFGDLPQIVFNPRSQGYQCYEVIQDARYLWDLEQYEDFEAYPENLLKTARTIIACHDSTTLHAATGKCITGYGFEANQTLFSNFDQAVEFVKYYHCGMEFDEAFLDEPKNDYRILAVFAIAEAKETLEEILTGENEENPRIITQVQVAQRLLSEAERQFESIRIYHARAVENKKKSQESINVKHKLFQDIDEIIKRRYRTYKKERRAKMIEGYITKRDSLANIPNIFENDTNRLLDLIRQVHAFKKKHKRGFGFENIRKYI